MPNTGKLLEGFVEQIERILLPYGFTLKVNEKVFSDGGVQIAEFDIEIEGKVGTTKFRWLIECRDRPSQGPAPGSWIEQLKGRRDRFNFDKVIAVSTTGFAEGAKQYAEVSGIEVRTVTETNLNQISGWLMMDKMSLCRMSCKLLRATLNIDEIYDEVYREALIEVIKNIRSDSKMLISTETGEGISLATAFSSAVDNVEGLRDDVINEGGKKKIRLITNYLNDDSHYVVESKIGKIRVRQIVFHGELTASIEYIPISDIKRYSNISSDEDIASAASFKFDVDEKQVEISFHNIAETGETHVVLGVSKHKT